MTATAETLARWRDDPEAYFREVERLHLWSKQLELVQAVQEHDRVACRAANAVGKTVAAAAVLRHHLAGGPGSVAVATSATDAQLRRVLMREVRQGLKHAGGLFHGAVVTENEVRLADDWYLAGFATDVPEAMQGIHAERVLVVVDEASGVSEDIFDAIEGVLAGGDAKLLLIGNPLRTSGSFFDAFGPRADEYRTLTISAYDTPAFTGEKVPRELQRRLVSKRWVDRLEKRDRGGNTFRVKVLGQFPAEADDVVVSLGDLERAHSNDLEPGLPLVIGVDVARYGSDHTVIAVREGNRIRVVYSQQGQNLMQTAGRVTELARRLRDETGRRPTLVIDEIGVGAGLVDRLEELREFRIESFNAARSSSQPREFRNRRSQLWFLFSDVAALLDLDPRDAELTADLLAPTYAFTSDGKRQVEEKSATRKRLRRSPDRADSVLLTLAIDPPRAPGQPRPTPMRTYVARGTIDAPTLMSSPRRRRRRRRAAADAPNLRYQLEDSMLRSRFGP